MSYNNHFSVITMNIITCCSSKSLTCVITYIFRVTKLPLYIPNDIGDKACGQDSEY